MVHFHALRKRRDFPCVSAILWDYPRECMETSLPWLEKLKLRLVYIVGPDHMAAVEGLS